MGVPRKGAPQGGRHIGRSVGDHCAAVGVRYQHGFTDVLSDATVKSRVFSVYVSFDFSMKR